MVIPIISIVLGMVYLIKPTVFTLGLRKKVATSPGVTSPGNYLGYVRILGIAFIAVGFYMAMKRM